MLQQTVSSAQVSSSGTRQVNASNVVCSLFTQNCLYFSAFNGSPPILSHVFYPSFTS